MVVGAGGGRGALGPERGRRRRRRRRGWRRLPEEARAAAAAAEAVSLGQGRAGGRGAAAVEARGAPLRATQAARPAPPPQGPRAAGRGGRRAADSGLGRPGEPGGPRGPRSQPASPHPGPFLSFPPKRSRPGGGRGAGPRTWVLTRHASDWSSRTASGGLPGDHPQLSTASSGDLPHGSPPSGPWSPPSLPPGSQHIPWRLLLVSLRSVFISGISLRIHPEAPKHPPIRITYSIHLPQTSSSHTPRIDPPTLPHSRNLRDFHSYPPNPSGCPR